MSLSTVLVEADRVVVGTVFLWAGISKLRSTETSAVFVGAVFGESSLVGRFAGPLISVVAMAELVSVLLLGFGRSAVVALLLLATLLSAFTAVAVLALSRGVSADCGCLVGASGGVSRLLVLRNLTLLSMVVVPLVAEWQGWYVPFDIHKINVAS